MAADAGSATALPPATLASISAAVGQAQVDYHASLVEDGYLLSNAAHAAPDLGVEARVALEMLAGAVLQAQGPLVSVFRQQARWEQTDERELAAAETGRPHQPLLSLP